MLLRKRSQTGQTKKINQQIAKYYLGDVLLPRHPSNAEIGYVYDTVRQQQNQQIENKLYVKKFLKKMDKLTGKKQNCKT